MGIPRNKISEVENLMVIPGDKVNEVDNGMGIPGDKGSESETSWTWLHRGHLNRKNGS